MNMSEKKCNVCGSAAETGFELCWNCSSPLDLSEADGKRLAARRAISNFECGRCKGSMRYAGLKKFHEGAHAWGFWLGDLGELFTSRELYDVYICPSCGKVEFYIDGIGDEKRPDGKKAV